MNGSQSSEVTGVGSSGANKRNLRGFHSTNEDEFPEINIAGEIIATLERQSRNNIHTGGEKVIDICMWVKYTGMFDKSSFRRGMCICLRGIDKYKNVIRSLISF